jgi:hypothetical protein
MINKLLIYLKKNKLIFIYSFVFMLNFLFIYFIINYNQNNLHIFFNQEEFFISIIINIILISVLFFNIFLFTFEFIFYKPTYEQKIFITMFNISNLILIIYIIVYIILIIKLNLIDKIDVEKAIRIIYNINNRIKHLMMATTTIIPIYIWYKIKINKNKKDK